MENGVSRRRFSLLHTRDNGAERPLSVCLNQAVLAVDRAGAFDKLQIIVLRKVKYKTIGHWFYLVELAVDKNSFLAGKVSGTDITRVLHLFLGTKRRQNATKPFRPVAGTESFAITGQADNDERCAGRKSHVLEIVPVEALRAI
jgi:hypothetical protein